MWIGVPLGLFLLLLVLTAGLQWRNSAYEAELGSRPDEAAHYVTGLMVRDYMAALAPGPPMVYAEQYYIHYPKIGIGHWPPVFYVVEAVWMLVFSESHVSMMLLMATCAAALGTLAGVTAAHEYGRTAGIMAGVAVVLVFWCQNLARIVTPDLLVALLILGAGLVYARYLRSPTWRLSVAFGLVASLACMTKGTGFVLAFVPPLGALMTRRLSLLKDPRFWLPAGIVGVLCTPWYLLAPSGMHTAAYSGRAMFLTAPLFTAVGTWVQLARHMGGPLTALAALGVPVVVFRRGRNRVRLEWVVMVALVAGYWGLCIAVAPARDPKNLIVCAAPMVLLAAAAIAWLNSRGPIQRLPPRIRAALLMAVVAGFGIHQSSRPEPFERRGYEELARDLLSNPSHEDSAVLISADGAGEGAMVVQVAMREERPGSYLLRGSKVLGKSGWFGENRQLRYGSAAEVMEFLESVPVTTVVLDSTGPPVASYHDQLQQAIRENPDRWQLVARYPKRPPANAAEANLVVYRMAGQEPRPVGRIRIDLESSLGRVVVSEPD